VFILMRLVPGDIARLTTYTRLRTEGRRLFPPTQAIRSIKRYHRQIYKHAYHRPKLAMLPAGKGTRPLLGRRGFS